MRSRELLFSDQEDIYNEIQGEMVVNDVPGSRSVPIRGLVHDIQHFRDELRLPHIQYIVQEQLENGKVVAAKNKGTEIVLYVANHRTAIAAGSTALVGLGALHFFRRRNH